mgnify:CR=1 FL=1
MLGRAGAAVLVVLDFAVVDGKVHILVSSGKSPTMDLMPFGKSLM